MFSNAELSGFLRDARTKIENVEILVGAIGDGKMAIIGLDPENPLFQSEIPKDKADALNAEVKAVMLEVSATLAKVASAIEDGVPKKTDAVEASL